MKKVGWGRTLVVLGLTLAATTVPVNAGYVLSIAGNGSVNPDRNGAAPGWGVLPGGTFQVDAVLTGNPPNTHDSAIFDVKVTGPRSLQYNGYLWDIVKYQSGSADDFSIPKGALDTGIISPSVLITNSLYPQTPALADVHFEAVTRQGQTFGVGTLVTLNLQMPANAVPGEQFTIAPLTDTFALLGDVVDTTNGSSLGVVVVPEPATLVLLGLGGLAAARRRLIGA